VVIYGDTDSIVLFRNDADVLFNRYPEMLNVSLSTNVTMGVYGEVECQGDITIVGKKLYYLSDTKFSAKGHNRTGLTRDHFIDALAGKKVTTSRMSPYKEVHIDNKKLHAHITPFVEQTRTLAVTEDEYKTKQNVFYTGPVFHMHT
jgi:hypothetical protein